MVDDFVLDSLTFALEELDFKLEENQVDFMPIEDILGSTSLPDDMLSTIDSNCEFDAPKYCDLSMWQSKVDLFGLEAYYETPLEKKMNEKWFRQLHLDHEHDEIYEAPNLLLLHGDGSEEDEELSNAATRACADYAASFVNELESGNEGGQSELEDEEVGNQKRLAVLFPKAFTSNFSHTKRMGSKRTNNPSLVLPSNINHMEPTGTLQKSNDKATANVQKTRRLPEVHRMLRRNITSREEKENELFLRDENASSANRLTRVAPNVCKAPTVLKKPPLMSKIKKEKEIKTDDIRELLIAQHAASKQYRLSKQQQPLQQQKNTQISKTNSANVFKVKKEESEILSLLKKHNNTAHHHQKQLKKCEKEDTDLLSLLQKHNSSLKRR